MASEVGSDPSEDAAKLFAVTESLVGAGIAPAIHLGRGIVISELSRSTVAATIETGEDEEPYVFEIVKGELWRAVKLLEELDGGPAVPSATVSRDSKSHRSKMADMFLTTEMLPMGRASTSSSVVPLARTRVGSLSPAAANDAQMSSHGFHEPNRLLIMRQPPIVQPLAIRLTLALGSARPGDQGGLVLISGASCTDAS